jgi:hypothetical protein
MVTESPTASVTGLTSFTEDIKIPPEFSVVRKIFPTGPHAVVALNFIYPLLTTYIPFKIDGISQDSIFCLL